MQYRQYEVKWVKLWRASKIDTCVYYYYTYEPQFSNPFKYLIGNILSIHILRMESGVLFQIDDHLNHKDGTVIAES